jgi:hypothetical protein
MREKMMARDKTCDIKNNKKTSRGADKIERKQLKIFACINSRQIREELRTEK